MFTREELLNDPEYWFEGEQNELFRQVSNYMKDENINRTELAKRLNVSKGYISQILNGDFNFSLRKLIEIGLSIGKVPQIKYEDVESVIKKDEQLKVYMNFKNTGNIIPIDGKITYNDYKETYNNSLVMSIPA